MSSSFATPVPDPEAVARARTAPEQGPHIVFFSGGTALRATSRALKHLTHNSVHLVTPFDSGGSSAHLRDAFSMCAVGDIRNRILALADEDAPTHAPLFALLAHRFDQTGENQVLDAIVEQMEEGEHPLVKALPSAQRDEVVTCLAALRPHYPDGFEFRGASVGNLVLTGGYFLCARDIDAGIHRFSALVGAKGTVRPIVDSDLHLRAELADGRAIVGQHHITQKETQRGRSKIVGISLVDAEHQPATATATEDVCASIRDADLICFPMGSFFSSVVANLLPRGVGRAIADAECPKIFVPNMVDDVEQRHHSVADAAQILIDFIRSDWDNHRTLDQSQALTAVMLDATDAPYPELGDLQAIEAAGVEVFRARLTTADAPHQVNAVHLSELLVSLARSNDAR